MHTATARPHIGVIRSVGIGPEIINVAVRTLEAVAARRRLSIHIDAFDPTPVDIRPDDATLAKLAGFYARTRDAGGVILRASCHATLVYRLRQQFDLLYKLVPLQPIPELADASLVDLSRFSNFDVLLIRDNAQGPYHAPEQVETDAAGSRTVRLDVTFSEDRIRRLARHAFETASRRRNKVHLLLKGDVHRELLGIWLAAMEDARKAFPTVEFDWDQPDCGLADLFTAPHRFDTLIATDVDADIIGDWLSGLLHGTRAITPSGNFSSPTGFASYQTIHGTCDRLAGTGKANPLGIMMAVGMLLEHSFGLTTEAGAIRSAIRHVLAQGHRTGDLLRPGVAPAKPVLGTEAMAELVLDALPGFLPAAPAEAPRHLAAV
jgi:3-isopropylmalate dehydrogenase